MPHNVTISTDGTVPGTRITVDGEKPWVVGFSMSGKLDAPIKCVLKIIDPETKKVVTLEPFNA